MTHISESTPTPIIRQVEGYLVVIGRRQRLFGFDFFAAMSLAFSVRIFRSKSRALQSVGNCSVS